MASDLLDDKKCTFGKPRSFIFRYKNDTKKIFFVLLFSLIFLYFIGFRILHLRRSGENDALLVIENAGNDGNDAFDRHYGGQGKNAKTTNAEIPAKKIEKVEERKEEKGNVVDETEEKRKTAEESGIVGEGKELLPVYPTEKKTLRQGGLKFFIYNKDTEHDIKHHHTKTLLFVFNKEEGGDEENEEGGDDADSKQNKEEGNDEADNKVKAGIEASLLSPRKAAILDALTHVANVFSRQNILHIYVENKYVNDFTFLFNDDYEKELPFAMIVEIPKGWKKYRYIQDDKLIDKSKLEQFEQNFFAGKLVPYLRSESVALAAEEVEGRKSYVKRLVTAEFESKIMKSKTDALIFFYASWCGHCKTFEGKFERLAAKFAAIRSVGFFKMDVTKNDIDHPHVVVERVPYVRFFKKNEKSGPPIKFEHIALNQNEKYGEEFILQNATCQRIDLQNHIDCDVENSSHEL